MNSGRTPAVTAYRDRAAETEAQRAGGAREVTEQTNAPSFHKRLDILESIGGLHDRHSISSYRLRIRHMESLQIRPFCTRHKRCIRPT